jgi:hypothetical protein
MCFPIIIEFYSFEIHDEYKDFNIISLIVKYFSIGQK